MRKGRPVVAVSAFAEGNLKDRVKNVLTEQKYSYIASFAAVAVVIIAGTVLLTGAPTKSEDISPGASMTETQDESAEAEVSSLVENFGKKTSGSFPYSASRLRKQKYPRELRRFCIP